MEVSEKLRKLRTEHKITQRTLAESIGVSRVTLGKWETGKIEPSVDILYKYRKLFGLENDFFDKIETVTFDVSPLNFSGRRELKKFYNSLINKKEYLKKP